MQKKVKIGFLGLGNVGCGVYRILTENCDRIAEREGVRCEIGRVLVRDVNKPRNVDFNPQLLTTSVEDIIDDPTIDIVAEYIGGEEPARTYLLRAMAAGKTVVTANKEVIARHGPELYAASEKYQVGLFYEASACGGIPVIKVLTESLQGNQIRDIKGIINGTTNYILTRMGDDGLTFEDALAEAQRLGIAEPDPSSDVEGRDSVFKLSIMATLAFHRYVPVEQIYCEGIFGITQEDIAYGRQLGFVVKLLAIGKQRENGIEARVHPAFVPLTHPLAAVRDANNAVYITGDAVGDLMLFGKGAGEMPTGSAVVSDIITAARTTQDTPRHTVMGFQNEGTFRDQEWRCEYFIRLSVRDEPGVLAKIASIFGIYEVSIASVIQKDHNKQNVPLVFVTHATREKALRKAMNAIADIVEVLKVENVIRVER